jgi:hypothetical protein
MPAVYASWPRSPVCCLRPRKTRFRLAALHLAGRDFHPRVASKGFAATASSFPSQEARRGLVLAQCCQLPRLRPPEFRRFGGPLNKKHERSGGSEQQLDLSTRVPPQRARWQVTQPIKLLFGASSPPEPPPAPVSRVPRQPHASWQFSWFRHAPMPSASAIWEFVRQWRGRGARGTRLLVLSTHRRPKQSLAKCARSRRVVWRRGVNLLTLLETQGVAV